MESRDIFGLAAAALIGLLLLVVRPWSALWWGSMALAGLITLLTLAKVTGLLVVQPWSALWWASMALAGLIILLTLAKVTGLRDKIDRGTIVLVAAILSLLLVASFSAWCFWPLHVIETPRKHTETLISLHDLYKSDFSNLFKLSNELKAYVVNSDGTQGFNMSFGASISFDYSGNSKFYSIYIPKAQADQSFRLCMYLAWAYPDIMRQLSNKVFTEAKPLPSDPLISSKDLTFSGRIYIYHEDDMTFRQRAEIEELFKSNGAFVIFRGLDYLQTRWIEDASKKAPSTPPPLAY